MLGIILGACAYMLWFLAICLVLKICYLQFFDILAIIGCLVGGVALFALGCFTITAAGLVGTDKERSTKND